MGTGKFFLEIWDFIRPVKKKLLYAILLSLGSVIAGFASLILFAFIISEVQNNTVILPWYMIFLLVVSTLSSCLMRLMSLNQSHYGAFRLETILRVRITEHLSKVPMSYIDDKGSGELAKVLQDDVKSLHVFIADSFPLYARAYISPVITFILIVFIDWRLALITLAIVVIGFVIIKFANRNRMEMVGMYYQAKQKVNTSVVDFIQAMPIVRTFEHDGDNFSRFKDTLDEYLKVLKLWYEKTGFAVRLSMLILSTTSTLIATLWLGSLFVWNNSLSFESWVAVLLIGMGMAEAFMPLMALKPLIDKTTFSISSIQSLLSVPVLEEPSVEQSQVPHNSSICFKNVSVSHKEQKNSVLNNVSFSLEPNTVTAVVGSSGAGKSTLVNLIPRFQDAFTGHVMIGDVQVKNMRLEVLMKHISFVSQKTFMFSGTIASNITGTTPSSTVLNEESNRQKIIEAAKIAQIDDFITSLPDGYDTAVGERGVFISGGQAQRLSIARAIMQNRPILILDEATSQLDAENEISLMQSLSEYLYDKTVLIITHRLNSVQNVDKILVLEKGVLVSEGKHDDLLNISKAYKKLWDYYLQSIK